MGFLDKLDMGWGKKRVPMGDFKVLGLDNQKDCVVMN